MYAETKDEVRLAQQDDQHARDINMGEEAGTRRRDAGILCIKEEDRGVPLHLYGYLAKGSDGEVIAAIACHSARPCPAHVVV